MNLFTRIKALLKPQDRQADYAIRDAFLAACEGYEKALDAVDPYTTRAEKGSPLDPYTRGVLEEHSSAIDALVVAFEMVSSKYSKIKPGDRILKMGSILYETTCTSFRMAADGYMRAILCASRDAAAGELQAAKDHFRADLLAATDPALKSKAESDASRANDLQEIATRLQIKADKIVVKAQAGHK